MDTDELAARIEVLEAEQDDYIQKIHSKNLDDLADRVLRCCGLR